ncbi:MAG: lysophospholipid acyltransferase family protein [Planctomycetota bacterium]|nr:lysophospholipid acyltransferase family protein [Planctomycetota bacterium]
MITALFIVWCLLIALTQRVFLPWLGNRVMGDGRTAAIWYFNIAYVHAMHRLKAFGVDIIPQSVFPGPIVVIANHQSPVDPLLIQSQCRFKIRWLMASEYMINSLSLIWELSEAIPVNRDGQDSMALRTALRHLKSGGVIGLFPEGRIEGGRNTIQPFNEGAGAMIAKTKAKVLIATIDGTPVNDDIEDAMLERSHSVVRFIDFVSFPDSMNGEEITSALRERFAEETGWPLVD